MTTYQKGHRRVLLKEENERIIVQYYILSILINEHVVDWITPSERQAIYDFINLG